MRFVPDLFQELRDRHFAYRRDFRPSKTQGESRTIRSFFVEPDRFKDWLGQVAAEDSRNKRNDKLRVILGYVGKGAEYEYMIHGQEWAKEDIQPNPGMAALPFSKENCRLLCRNLRLPQLTPLLPTRGASGLRGHFQVIEFPSDGHGVVYGLTLIVFNSLLIGMKVSVSMSYRPSTGVINALLLGSGPQDGFAWLQEDLEHMQPLADNNFDRLHEVEFGSGQMGIMMLGGDGMPIPRGNCENPTLSISVLGVAQQALAIEAYIKGHILTVHMIKSEISAFPWRQILSIDYDQVQEQNTLIVKQLEFISRMLDFALIRIEHLKQRANVQGVAIANILAQRNNETNRRLTESSTSIAHDTRRDSLAMKSIAILTMVFLPPTFTATYFSTPAIAAVEPSQGLYWIVTVPLTLVVITVWLFSLYYWVGPKLFPRRKDGFVSP